MNSRNLICNKLKKINIGLIFKLKAVYGMRVLQHLELPSYKPAGAGPLTQSTICLSHHIYAPLGSFTFGGNKARNDGATAPSMNERQISLTLFKYS
jgi:hypothetical protein